jgi:alanine-glyoxylate transaminase/serine-glyoxylate transaminase/serine-pyruvate transaminase
VLIPEEVDDVAARRRLLEEYGIDIAGALGSLKGKCWRVGLMGHSCRRENVLTLLAALERIVRR